jgi:hypothetical protein
MANFSIMKVIINGSEIIFNHFIYKVIIPNNGKTVFNLLVARNKVSGIKRCILKVDSPSLVFKPGFWKFLERVAPSQIHLNPIRGGLIIANDYFVPSNAVAGAKNIWDFLNRLKISGYQVDEQIALFEKEKLFEDDQSAVIYGYGKKIFWPVLTLFMLLEIFGAVFSKVTVGSFDPIFEISLKSYTFSALVLSIVLVSLPELYREAKRTKSFKVIIKAVLIAFLATVVFLTLLSLGMFTLVTVLFAGIILYPFALLLLLLVRLVYLLIKEGIKKK